MKRLKFGGRCRRWAARVGVIVVCALAAGCGGGEGKISGQVLYEGKPVPGGWVIFRPADGRQNTIQVEIDANGHYEATLPTGEVKIAVDNRDRPLPTSEEAAPGPELPSGIKPPKDAKAEAPESKKTSNNSQANSGKYIPLPDKYYDVDKSGLTYKVESGSHTHNIELK
jgi:hypothetical protein